MKNFNVDFALLILYNIFIVSTAVQLIMSDHPWWAALLFLLVGGTTRTESAPAETHQPQILNEKETPKNV